MGHRETDRLGSVVCGLFSSSNNGNNPGSRVWLGGFGFGHRRGVLLRQRFDDRLGEGR
jgi:hypothetical protein